jgi:hypothetical protein
MLNVIYGVLAIVPTAFGVAGYMLVSRHCAVPNVSIAPLAIQTC